MNSDICSSELPFTAAYPVEKFKGALSSGTSFNFSWSPPSIAAELTTGYSLKCAPLLAGIPALQALTIAPANTTAVVYGLKPGVTYDCSITTITDAGSSEPQTLTLTTPEIGKHCSCRAMRSFLCYSSLRCSRDI